MRILSLRPPWGWAVVWAGKSPENRTWPTRYRGPVFIHQALHRAYADMDSSEHAPARLAWETRGAIIGCAELVDCHPDAKCCRPWGESSFTSAGGLLCKGVWHLTLEGVRAIDPIPARGRQGLWKPDHDLACELEPHLAEATGTR